MTSNHLYPIFATVDSGTRRGIAAPNEDLHMKLLHIDSSALGQNSVTRELGAAIVAH